MSKTRKSTSTQTVQGFVKAWTSKIKRLETMRRKFEAEAACKVTVHYVPEATYWFTVAIKQGLEPALQEILGPKAAVLGPMGLFCNLTAVPNRHRMRSPSLALRFRNSNDKASLHFVLPSELSQAKFAPNTIGAINGGNQQSIPIPDDFTVGQFVDLLLSGVRAQKKYFKTLLK